MEFTRCESWRATTWLDEVGAEKWHERLLRRVLPRQATHASQLPRLFTGAHLRRMSSVVASQGWQIRHTDTATMTVSFAAKGQKIRLGGGIEMSAFVAKRDDDTVRVSVGAAPAGLQALRLFDHGEKDEVSGLFFASLRDVLPTVDEPEPRGDAESMSAVDELERLARLHERGALDDDEFRRAKQRPLGH